MILSHLLHLLHLLLLSIGFREDVMMVYELFGACRIARNQCMMLGRVVPLLVAAAPITNRLLQHLLLILKLAAAVFAILLLWQELDEIGRGNHVQESALLLLPAAACLGLRFLERDHASKLGSHHYIIHSSSLILSRGGDATSFGVCAH